MRRNSWRGTVNVKIEGFAEVNISSLLWDETDKTCPGSYDLQEAILQVIIDREGEDEPGPCWGLAIYQPWRERDEEWESEEYRTWTESILGRSGIYRCFVPPEAFFTMRLWYYIHTLFDRYCRCNFRKVNATISIKPPNLTLHLCFVRFGQLTDDSCKLRHVFSNYLL